MTRTIASLALVVADYDEAIAFYVDTLGFSLIEDHRHSVTASDGYGSVLVGKRNHPVAGPGRRARTGGTYRRSRPGGRVFLFLETDDFARDHALFVARGVRFLEEPAL